VPDHILIITAGALSYLAAGLLLALGLVRAQPGLRNGGLLLAAIGAAVHGLVLWQSLRVESGWDVNFFNSLSLTAWLIAVMLIILLRSRLLVNGIVAFPGAAICLVLAALWPLPPLMLSDLPLRLELHIFSSLIAYCLLSIAAINALLLAVQDHLLRRPNHIRQLEMLPPLNALESLLFGLIGAGWLVLTISLVTGLMYIDNLLAQHLLHKTVLTGLSWLLFSMLLIGRWWYGWRGRRAIRFTLAAMFALLLGYFGSKGVLEVLLDRTWSSPPALETPTPDQ